MNKRFRPVTVLMLAIFIIFGNNSQAGTIKIIDSTNRTVILKAPARRIVSLAPHLTEMLFSAKAGKYIVGTVHYSDYPLEAKKIPQVGGYHQLDLEKIYALQPDLIVAWAGGNEKHEVQMLMDLDIPVFISDPHRVVDIVTEIETLSKLTATDKQTAPLLKKLHKRWNSLATYSTRTPKLRVFYQLWNSPIMTINREHIINDVIRQCGGVNPFGDLPILIPRISKESVIEANPDVIIASGMSEERPDWLKKWENWNQLTAVKTNHLFFIPPDIIQRQSSRILEGAEMLCNMLEKARHDVTKQ
ncbi:MAG: cobalamin-binding protein [Magnetococcales bacterium]|nr:cobalamin-binding protein [Magnetococcales bacterium]